jgi:ribosomal protein L28
MSRKRRWLPNIWERLSETKPVLVSISQRAVKHLAEAAKTSRTTSEGECAESRPRCLMPG